MTKEERVWWMVLLDADTQSEIYARHGDGEGGIRASHVGNQARKTLVTKFGANLDDIGLEARELYHQLYEEREKADAAEKQRALDYEALIARAEELLRK